MADKAKVDKGLEKCLSGKIPFGCGECPYYGDEAYTDAWSCRLSLMRDANELLKSKPDIDKIVKELDDTSKQYEPRPFESINWMLRYEGIMIGLEIAQYVVKGEPIPDKF